jgi:hypothetical protein
MCPACATVVLTIAGVSYAVNKLRKQNSAADDVPQGRRKVGAQDAARLSR